MNNYIQALKILWPALKQQKKLLIYVVTGILLLIGMSTAFLEWRTFFYNNVQAYNSKNIYLGLLIFTGLALVYVFIYGLTSFYTRYLEFGCRQFLYEKFSPLASLFHEKGIANTEQRIQDDTLRFSKTSIALLKALLDSSVRLPIFLFILASTAKAWMIAVVLIYAIVGTILSRKVANKLIVAEYTQESLEAKLRRDIIVSIDKKSNMPTLKEIMGNWNELALRQKYLSYYTSFYGQISVIFPFVMLIPMFLSKTILLGTLFATASAIEQVLGSLSVFVDSRDLVVDLSMTTRRLKELEIKNT